MAVTSPGPRLLLADHHHAIEAACAALRAEVYADESWTLIDRYRRFEHAVLLHIELEERELLPAFGQFSMLAASQIRLQHVELRDQLYHLGIDVELHRARAERFELMIDTLQRHVRLEETLLYPWAEEHLSLHSRRSLFVRLGRSLRDLARPRTRQAA